MIDAYASEEHFVRHLEPIWETLGEPGTWYGPGDRVEGFAPILVCSMRDYLRTGRRPVIYVEHGAGQTYGGTHPSYSGGSNRSRTILFLCPSETVAERNRRVYDCPSAVVGCPALDRWHLSPPKPIAGRVSIAFHWDAIVVPESRSALGHYEKALRELANRFDIIGTAHPRAIKRVAKLYEQAGIPIATYDEIMDTASVLVADNTSMIYEFASTDRPVVLLNAPWYRRHIEHGLRFWEHADVGVQCDWPGDLLDAIELAMRDLPGPRRRRSEITQAVYAYTDGRSAQRAATAIMEVLAWAPSLTS